MTLPEYVDIPEEEYDPKIKIMGLEVCVTLARPGYRIKKRRISPRKIHHNHIIGKEDAMKFMQEKFGIKVGEEE